MRMLARRIGFYLLTAIAAVTVIFLLPRVIPGNPVDAVIGHMQGQTITKSTLRALEVQFGQNSTTGTLGQYLHYWRNLAHGNLGVSTSEGMVPVTTVIRGALPWTLGLVGTATVISFILGTLLGILIAIKLGWFPPGSARGILDFPAVNWTYISDVLDHAVLPALTIVVASGAGWIVGMRNVMVTTMDEDYVLMAQAKGLPKRRVVWYAARNAILPSISSFSLAIGFVVSGALLTEIVFSYPGLGFILLNAVQEADYALLQGVFLVITMAVLVANLAADFVYVFLDPRTRQEA